MCSEALLQHYGVWGQWIRGKHPNSPRVLAMKSRAGRGRCGTNAGCRSGHTPPTCCSLSVHSWWFHILLLHLLFFLWYLLLHVGYAFRGHFVCFFFSIIFLCDFSLESFCRPLLKLGDAFLHSVWPARELTRVPFPFLLLHGQFLALSLDPPFALLSPGLRSLPCLMILPQLRLMLVLTLSARRAWRVLSGSGAEAKRPLP